MCSYLKKKYFFGYEKKENEIGRKIFQFWGGCVIIWSWVPVIEFEQEDSYSYLLLLNDYFKLGQAYFVI